MVIRKARHSSKEKQNLIYSKYIIEGQLERPPSAAAITAAERAGFHRSPSQLCFNWAEWRIIK